MERIQVEFDALAERAISNFEPARKIWPTSIRLVMWLGMEAVVLGLVALIDPRPDLLAQLHNPGFLAPIGVFILGGAIAAGLALRAAIPGREPALSELILVALVAPLAVAVVFLTPDTATVSFLQFIRAGSWCLGCTLGLAAMPWLVLFWAVERGAPFMLGTEGALVGAAAFSFAFAASRLGCPIDDRLHILVWHVLPVFVATLLSIRAGAAWLQRERASRIDSPPRFHAL
jgi:hypothetical protein